MTGARTSCDITGTKATKLELASTESTMWATELESEECATKLKAAPTQVTLWGVVTRVGVCENVMEWLRQSTVGLCVSNQDSPKTIGCRGVQ